MNGKLLPVRRLWPWALAAFLAAGATFAAAIPSGFVFDDEFFIERNLHLRDWSGLPRIFNESMTAGSGMPSNFYRPLQAATHFLDARLWGTAPGAAPGHHLTSVLLHGCAAAAVFLWLAGFFAPAAALAAALLYALHPLHAEAVDYISGRGDTLSILFVATGLAAFRLYPAFGLGCAALALLSKENAVMFPVLLLLSEWAAGRPIAWRRHFPFWLLAAAYTGLRITVLNFSGTLNFYGAERNIFTDNFIYRLYTYLATLPLSLRLWLWPSDLHHERSFSVHVNFLLPGVVGSALGCLAIFGAGWLLRRESRVLLAAAAFYLAATLPTSNLLAIINALFYDHWFLLPGLGLALLAAKVFSRFEPRNLIVMAAPLAGLLAGLTQGYHPVWRDGAALNTHILRYEPGNAKAHHNLAMALADRGRKQEAMEHYRQAIAAGGRYPETHHNLGELHGAAGDLEAAAAEYRRALELNPAFHHSLRALGALEMQRGHLNEAEACLLKAAELQPEAPDTWLLLAELYTRANRPERVPAALRTGSERTRDPRFAAELRRRAAQNVSGNAGAPNKR